MLYLVKSPGWIKKVFKSRVWEIHTDKKELFLSFDDGPHPVHTSYVLDELKKYNAKATFFCIGKNVLAYPDIYRRIIEEGHATGNHTFDHLNASKTADDAYLNNIKLAGQCIDSKLFRPPYGRISGFLVDQLLLPGFGLKTIMWSVLSGDFDVKITTQQCLENVLLNAHAGSIVVFHDSEKASEKMEYALPRVLEYFAGKGFDFKAIKLS